MTLTGAPASAEAETNLEPYYDRITEIAWRTLRRMGVSEASLPDAVQDTLLVLHRRRDEFRGESSLYTWLYGVLRRVASNYHRSQRRANAVFDFGGLPEGTHGTEPSPLEHCEKRTANRLLHAVLDELPLETRAPFVLVELEELEIAEAALVLEVSISTCKSRLRKARRLFNASLARHRARFYPASGGNS